VRLSADLPNTDSGHARLGSAAHALGERCLLNGEDPFEFLGDPHPDKAFVDITVDTDMVDAVNVYVDHIRKYGKTLRNSNIEVRVSLEPLGEWAKGMFGTADFCAHDRAVLLVDDYKHGQGIAVDVDNNRQLKYYGLGAYLQLNDLQRERLQQIRTTIIQPRKPHRDGPVRTAIYSVKEILDWAEQELKPAVLAVDDPDAPLVPSEKACQFCAAKGICPALAEKAMSTAELDFMDGEIVTKVSKDKLTPEQIKAILDGQQFVLKWIAAVASHAELALQRGGDVTGGAYKLVNGKSSRSWKDESAAAKAMRGFGFDDKQLYPVKEPSFLSPAQAEKLAGKQQKEQLAKYIGKQPGKPILAPADDKREAVEISPQDDFNEADDLLS